MDLNVVSIQPEGGARRHPLLFVHGAWHGAWCWERFLPWFAARGWACHAVDLRGHGDSPNDRSLRFTRIRHYVEDVAGVIDAIDGEPILIGHSMGGLIAQRFLEEQDLPGAVLLAPVPIGGVIGATLRTARRHPIKFLKSNLVWDLRPLVETRRVAADLMFAADMDPDEIDVMWPRLQGESYLAYLEMIFTVLPRPQLVHTPVTIVAGTEDRLFSVRSQRRTARAYGTELHLVEGAAHDLMLDPEWRSVAELVAGALEP